ncbi:MAG: hypothetical protein ABII72_04940 [Parcubacteria group bacterium]
MAKKIAWLLVLVISSTFSSGCAGWGQNIIWAKETYGDCWVGYDAAGYRHEDCSDVQTYPDPDWEREERRLDRIIENNRRRQQDEMEVRADHARRAMQACREGRWSDLSRSEVARCRQLRAAGKIH